MNISVSKMHPGRQLSHQEAGTEMQNDRTPRLYSELAWLWPLWGDPAGEYAEYCEEVTRLIRQNARRAVHSVLIIGCGGGKNAFNLKRNFQVTGLDLSPDMLKLARNLNPECEFVEGDMRDCNLGRTFDAILMDDGLSYMTSRNDLKAAFKTARRHLAPGGVLVTTPDSTTETFIQSQTSVTPGITGRGPEGTEVIFIENNYDPDLGDDWYETTMVFLIRESGKLRIETDHHRLGLFPVAFWRKTLADIGCTVFENSYRQDETNYTTFACVSDPAGT